VSLKLNTKKLLKTAIHRETYKKQSGGRGKSVISYLNLSQLMMKLMVSSCWFILLTVKGGNVPKEYIPSVEKV
jgi:elongation factor G